MPGATDEATVIDMLKLPVPVIEPGEANVTVTPAGAPEADRTAAVLNPPVTVLVMLEEPEPPCTIETEPGEALRLKPIANEKSEVLGKISDFVFSKDGSNVFGVLAVDDSGHTTFVHDEDPVAHAQNLRQL